MTSLLSVEGVAPILGKYVQAILNLRGSRHRAEGWSKTKNNHCNQCLDTKNKNVQWANTPRCLLPSKAWRRTKETLFCLRLALKIVLRRKKLFCLSMAKKNTWKLFSLPVSLAHPRRHLLEQMLRREHALMSSILEDLVSRREHWRCRRSPNLGCCPSTNSLLIDGLKRGKTDLPWWEY